MNKRNEFLKFFRVAVLGTSIGVGLHVPGHAESADAHGAPAPASKAASPAQVRRSSDQTLSLIREASLALLKEGNQRYVTGRSLHPNQDGERRALAVAEGQKPFATILACSDSRSPVEVLFDRGVGELFVVRVAGNVATESQVATIEYGVGHLGTPLIVVLGHTACGAVTAAVKGGEVHGHLAVLVNKIAPAVVKARAAGTHPDRLLAASIQSNVWQQMEDLIGDSEVVRDGLKDGSVQLVGGIYDLEKGSVSWLGAHPAQSALIAAAEEAEKAAEAGKHPQASTAPAAEDHDSTPGAQGSDGARTSGPTSFPGILFPTRDVKARAPKPAAEPAAPAPAHSGHH